MISNNYSRFVAVQACTLEDMPRNKLIPVQLGFHYILIHYDGHNLVAFDRFVVSIQSPLDYQADVEDDIVYNRMHHLAFSLKTGFALNLSNALSLSFYQINMIDKRIYLQMPDDYDFEYFYS